MQTGICPGGYTKNGAMGIVCSFTDMPLGRMTHSLGSDTLHFDVHIRVLSRTKD